MRKYREIAPENDPWGWGKVGSVIFLQTSLLFGSTHAHSYVEVSQLNKLPIRSGRVVPGRDDYGVKRPRNENVNYVTSQYCAIGTGQSKS